MQKLPVAILGATGMVGQRFATLLQDHPWFQVVGLAASPRSRGKMFAEAVDGRWRLSTPVPESLKHLTVQSVEDDLDIISRSARVVFCALDMEKERIKELEIRYADRGVAVISNNSAHRWTADVPMIMPEINPHHTDLIDVQRKQRGWSTGLIAVKPNCSIQSYVAILTALAAFQPRRVSAVSLQAISGAGKTFSTWPEMTDNVIPFISGEEEKSEKEPLKIWGTYSGGAIHPAAYPHISATCIRVPVSDGHMVHAAVSFAKKPSREDILHAFSSFGQPLASLHLPSAPDPLIRYYEESDRPQTGLDRMQGNGMGITVGRLREDRFFDWRFIALSHNTIRGAAGGAILTAELLKAKGYLE